MRFSISAVDYIFKILNLSETTGETQRLRYKKYDKREHHIPNRQKIRETTELFLLQSR